MRKALAVGIDHYARIPSLFGCVNDAHSVKSVLERNSDGTVNFAVKLLTGSAPPTTSVAPFSRITLASCLPEIVKSRCFTSRVTGTLRPPVATSASPLVRREMTGRIRRVANSCERVKGSK